MFYILMNWDFLQIFKSLSYQISIFYLTNGSYVSNIRTDKNKTSSVLNDVWKKLKYPLKLFSPMDKNRNKKCWSIDHESTHVDKLFSYNVESGHMMCGLNLTKYCHEKIKTLESYCYKNIKWMLLKTGTLACEEPELNGSSLNYWLCDSPTITNV